LEAIMQRVRSPWQIFFWASVAALVVGLVGCDFILGNELNPKYCAAHPDDADCMREMPTGYFPCKSSVDCTGQEGKPACTEPAKNGFGICVQCTASDTAACAGTTPLCEEENVCRGCSRHEECASAACLPDGSCVDEGSVAYVASTGTGTACTKTAPCGTVSAAVTTGKAYLKVATGTVKEAQVTILDGRTVTILADEGAKLDRDGDDNPVIRVQGAADVKIYDLEVTGASGNGAHGIELTAAGSPKLALTRVRVSGNSGGGISAQGGTLTVTQSTVSGNSGGGISVMNATFDITNNFIYRNGDSDGGGDFGGVSLNVATASGNRFEFNTVVDNHARAGGATVGGVRCDVTGLALANNIIARNDISRNVNATNANVLAAGACTYPSSIRDVSVSGLLFAEPEQAPYNYHLLVGSSAIDQSTTTSTVTVDADGDTRPQGAQKDIGADEYKP
jgi:Right handed beta helix region